MDELFEKALSEFMKLDDSPIRIVTHIDADGISSAAVLAKALQREGKKFIISAVRQLDEKKTKELAREDYKTIIFTDLGSGYLELIESNLQKKKVFIFDHHPPSRKEASGDIIHVNPHISGLSEDLLCLSGSGVVYLFAKKLNPKNINLAYIALVGVLGDVHEIEGPNRIILDDALQSGEIEVKKGLRMFGAQTKPLVNLLRYSTDPFIPGVTGDEKGIFLFLDELGIPASTKEGKQTRLVDLNEDETKRLVTGIILRRMGSEKDPEDVFGDNYLIKKEAEGSPAKDLKEFATLLNACGRMGRPSIGISACMGSESAKQKSLQVSHEYKQSLIETMNWFYQNKANPQSVIERKSLVIINASDKVKDTLIGTLASMLSKSNLYSPSTVIASMAHTMDDHIKISVRIVGASPDKSIDVNKILDNVLRDMGGETSTSGGHKEAAGALIPVEKENDFIKALLSQCGQ